MIAGFILTLLIIFLILWYAIQSEADDIYRNPSNKNLAGGNGNIHYKGLGSDEESIDKLLNRIYWTATADDRNNKWKRAYIIATIATLMIIVLIYRTRPSAKDIVLILIIIFIVCYAVFSFFKFHSDRFAPYYIRDDVIKIRNKLKLGNPKDPGNPSPNAKIPSYNLLSKLLSD